MTKHRFQYILLLILLLVIPLFEAEAKDIHPKLSVPYPNWDTGWFQVEIQRQLLQELGYDLSSEQQFKTSEAIKLLSEGKIDIWPSGWFPADNVYVDPFKDTLSIVGTSIDRPMVQGYLIDRKTVEQYNIQSLADLKNSSIARIFDFDGNGKADLLGCPEEWTCHKVIEHHIKDFGLEDTVEQISYDYLKNAKQAVDHLHHSQPVLIYSWNSHWLISELLPGRFSNWIPVPQKSYPEGLGYEKATTNIVLEGCLDNPCETGFAVSSIQSVLKKSILRKHPDIGRLLEKITIPLADISYQNSRLKLHNENTIKHVQDHASEWIALNRSKVNKWLKKAHALQSFEQESEFRPLNMARPTWDSNWFTAEVVRLLVQNLGYELPRPTSLGNGEAYKRMAEGSSDFWAAGNPANHSIYLTGQFQERQKQVEFVGKIFSNQVLQGYLIDSKFAKKLGIKQLDDFKDPEIAKHFDLNGNGKAELFGCNTNWSCWNLIDFQLKTLGLSDTVEQISQDYTRLILKAHEYLKSGKPVLIHAWSPYWVPSIFEVGRLTYWIPVSRYSLPDVSGKTFIDSSNVKGCLGKNPCRLGLPITDRQAVINSAFAKKHPDIKRLLELIRIAPEDIIAANVSMYKGHADNKMIERFAREWLEKNQSLIKAWLKEALSLQTKKVVIQKNIKPKFTQKSTINVVAKRFEPFVMFQDEQYTGFGLELWEAIANELGLKYKLSVVDSMAKVMDNIKRQASDVGISGIVITSDREKEIDFSHAFYESGLRILIKKDKKTPLGRVISNLVSFNFFMIIVGISFILLLAAHIIWLIEKKKNPEEFPQTYFAGILESVWWAGAVMSGREGWGKKLSQGAAKTFTFFWMFVGYFIFIYFTASMTTMFTVNELQGSISNYKDLIDRRVGTIKYSKTEDYLFQLGVAPITVRKIEKGIDMLRQGEIDALVYQEPILQHYVSLLKDKDDFSFVGSKFFKQNYGFALSYHSPIREDINKTLLQLIESGTYQKIYQKWFSH